MTDRELMQKALDAMDVLWDLLHDALRERLEPPKQPQWHMAGLSTPLRREWVGLTEAEKVNVAIKSGCADVAWMDFADAIEAKLKEKNA